MNLEALMALAQGKKTEIAAKSNFSNVTKIPMGKSRWRILPGWQEGKPETFFHDFGQHYIKDKDGNVVVVYVCEMDTFGRPCSICDSVNDLIRSTKDDATLKMLKEMKSRQVQLVNAVRLDGAEADPTKPLLLMLPPTSVTQAYLNILADYQTTYNINILSATEGRDITIERSGTGLTTKYSLQPAPSSTAVRPEALTRLHDISAYVESEFVKGVKKGTALFENTTRTIMSLSGAPAGQVLIPSGAGKVLRAEPSRIIESDLPETVWGKAPAAPAAAPTIDLTEAEVEAATAVATPAAAPAKPAAPKAAPKAADDTVLDDEELQKILAELG